MGRAGRLSKVLQVCEAGGQLVAVVGRAHGHERVQLLEAVHTKLASAPNHDVTALVLLAVVCGPGQR